MCINVTTGTPLISDFYIKDLFSTFTDILYNNNIATTGLALGWFSTSTTNKV